MLKIKELKQLAEILGERLKDEKPNQALLQRCVEAIWPYIYPYGLLSYVKEHAEDPIEKTDRLKMDKLLKAVTGSRRQWRSFVIGLCHTYRERHSLKRTRARLLSKATKKRAPLSADELNKLAEGNRDQALWCARAVSEIKMKLCDPNEMKEQIKLQRSVRNEENIPRFLKLSRYLDYEKLLQLVPAEILQELQSRYAKSTPQTLAFDALQDYIVFNDDLWKQFKEFLNNAYRATN